MENKYCIYCGAQNKAQAKFCAKCGKEMEPKENLLIDFLIKRTKDKFKGNVEDSFYETIKNFLLSHLYGTALTISFVSAVTVTAFANDSYITELSDREMETYLAAISNHYYEEHQYRENQGNQNSGVYSREKNSAVHSLISSYEHEALARTMIDSLGNPVTPNPDKYRLPASMGYGGVHEISPELVADVYGLTVHGMKERTEFNTEYHTTDIARRLTNDGYTVGECVVETRFENANGDTEYSYAYMAVAVLVDNQWLIAEDKILEVYKAGPRPVEYGFDTIAALETASDYYEAILTGGDGSHLLADSLLDHSVQHQLTYNEAMPYYAEGTDTETIYTKLIQTYEFTNNISETLRNEGYNVMEYLFEQTIYDTNNGYRVIGARDFCITVVEINGGWYVAEDVVIYQTLY